MRRSLVSVLFSGFCCVVLAGCTTPYGEPNRAGTGALIGGASGAGIGALLAHCDPIAGALFGGALGAMAGRMIGGSADQQAHEELYRATAPPPVAAQPPPAAPPAVAAPGPPPSPNFVWVNGRWVWDGRGWVWAQGDWMQVQ